MTCAICGNTTWLMFTIAASVRNAIGGKQAEQVLCHKCWRDRRETPNAGGAHQETSGHADTTDGMTNARGE